MHEAERLTVAFRVSHAEVPPQVLLGIAAFLMPDHHDAHPVEARPATHHGGIVAEQPVPVQLDEVREQDRKSTRLNSSHTVISYAVFCLKKKKNTQAKNRIQKKQ